MKKDYIWSLIFPFRLSKYEMMTRAFTFLGSLNPRDCIWIFLSDLSRLFKYWKDHQTPFSAPCSRINPRVRISSTLLFSFAPVSNMKESQGVGGFTSSHLHKWHLFINSPLNNAPILCLCPTIGLSIVSKSLPSPWVIQLRRLVTLSVLHGECFGH